MNIKIARGVDGARVASGSVVVIDVLRAFTTAAYAFDAGATEIELVGTVEEARARTGFRMGEVDGRLIPGFDHNNSPALMIGKSISGRVVQRTGAGTRCAVAVGDVDSLWVASLVVAEATVRALQGRKYVTLVATGDPGTEDVAAAAYIKDRLLGRKPNRQLVREMVLNSHDAAEHRTGDPERPLNDLGLCIGFDRFDFAMKAERLDGNLIVRKWYSGSLADSV